METTTAQTEKRDAGNFDALIERAPELAAWHGVVLDTKKMAAVRKIKLYPANW